MKLNDWVFAARKHAGMTQEALGEKLSVTKANVSAWENARHEPSFGQLQSISELTGYPLPPLPSRKAAHAAPSPTKPAALTPAGESFGKWYDSLTPQNQQKARLMVWVVTPELDPANFEDSGPGALKPYSGPERRKKNVPVDVDRRRPH